MAAAAESQDYYQVLAVPREASVDDVKKAYRTGALRWHPDKNAGDEESAGTMFRMIAEAYSVLSNPEKRSVYDRHGRAGLERSDGEEGSEAADNEAEGFRQGGFEGASVDPFAVFQDFFAGERDPFAEMDAVFADKTLNFSATSDGFGFGFDDDFFGSSPHATAGTSSPPTSKDSTAAASSLHSGTKACQSAALSVNVGAEVAAKATAKAKAKNKAEATGKAKAKAKAAAKVTREKATKHGQSAAKAMAGTISEIRKRKQLLTYSSWAKQLLQDVSAETGQPAGGRKEAISVKLAVSVRVYRPRLPDLKDFTAARSAGTPAAATKTGSLRQATTALLKAMQKSAGDDGETGGAQVDLGGVLAGLAGTTRSWLGSNQAIPTSTTRESTKTQYINGRTNSELQAKMDEFAKIPEANKISQDRHSEGMSLVSTLSAGFTMASVFEHVRLLCSSAAEKVSPLAALPSFGGSNFEVCSAGSHLAVVTAMASSVGEELGLGQDQGGGSSSSTAGPRRLLVQVLPDGWPPEATSGPRASKHLFWLRAEASGQKLVAAWCLEQGVSPESVRFAGPDGCELASSGSLLAARDLAPSDATAEGGGAPQSSDGFAPDVKLTVGPGPGPEAAQSWSALIARAVSAEQPELVGLCLVRVVAKCSDGESTLRFRVAPHAPLGKLMATWCRRQGLSRTAVRFATADGRELNAEDAVAKVQGPSPQTFEILAHPVVGDAALASQQLGQAAVAAAQTAAESTSTARPAGAAGRQDRVQVRIAAEGLLRSQLPAAKTPSPVQVPQGGGLSFWTKLVAPLGKVLAAWCKHHGFQSDDVFVAANGREVLADETAASRGWAPGSQVIFSAVRRSDSAAIERVLATQSLAAPAPAVQEASSAAFRPAGVAEKASSRAVGPEGSGPPVQADPADGRTLIRVLDGRAAGASCKDAEFRMRPSTSFERMMMAWCQGAGLSMTSVRFELLAGQGLAAGDLQRTDTPGGRGWWPGKGELRVRAILLAPFAADAAEGKPVQVQAEERTVQPVPTSKLDVKVVAQSAEFESVAVDFKMGLTTTFHKMMKAWCDHNSLPMDAASFELEGKTLAAEDSFASLGFHKLAGSPVVIHAFQIQSTTDSPQENKTTTGSVDCDKIQVKVVADGGDGDGPNVVDFKMKLDTLFEKMMKAWCKHHQVELSEVVFEIEGRELRPEDSPGTCGWTLSKGTLMVQARPREATDPVQETAPADTTAADTKPSVQTPDSASAAPKADSKHSGPSEKVNVQVVADDDGGLNTVDFKMKLATPFDKMMKAWCKHNGVELSEAIFEIEGRELLPDDCPDSLGWTVSKGTLVVQARPREVGDPAQEAQMLGPTASDSTISCLGEADTQPGVPLLPSPQVSGSDDKLEVHVVSWGEDGQNMIDFKMKVDTPFDNVIQAWCEHHEITQSEAIFAIEGCELHPGETPTSCGWTLSKGTLVVQARPREATDPDQETAPADTTAAAPTDSKNSDVSETVNVQVVADGDDGENVVDFNMKLTTPFDKMMKAWCKHNGVELSEAIFEIGERELQPDDCPDSLGWTLSKGTLVVQARPREDQETAPADTTVADSIGAGSCEADTKPSMQTPVLASAVPATDSKNSVLIEKVSVQVVADGDEGQNVVDFSMKLTTPFDKMMKAWCKHSNVELSEAIFKIEGRELQPDDCPDSLGWTVSKGTLVVQARPREVGDQGQKTAPADATEVDSMLSLGAGSDWADTKRSLQTIGSGSAAAATDSLASKISEKLHVQVVADGDEGQHVLDFRMSLDTQFDKMMKAWSKHNGVELSEVIFEIEGRELQPEDSPSTCGWSLSKGTLVLQAGPREALDPDQETAPADTTAADSISVCSEQVPGPMPSAASKAVGNDAKAPPGAVEKIDVRIVADGVEGQNVTNIKMKPNTPFDKMMSAWCKQYDIPRSSARFVLQVQVDGAMEAASSEAAEPRELLAEDSPASCGWTSAAQGQLLVRAIPKNHQESPAEVPVEGPFPAGGQVADEASGQVQQAAEAAAAASETHVGLPARAGSTASVEMSLPDAVASDTASAVMPSKIAEEERKVLVEVHAEGDDGVNVLSFKMKMDSTLEKMMKAWSKHHHITMEEVRFVFQDTDLQPGQTPLMLGWQPIGEGQSEGGAAITLHALPRARPVMQDSEDLPNEVAQVEEPQPEQSPPPAASIDVSVVADGQNGQNTLQFKMKLMTPFGKMMARWCSHHGVSQDQASFWAGDQELSAEQTPASLGWDSRLGEEMTIRAQPKKTTQQTSGGGGVGGSPQSSKRRRSSGPSAQPQAQSGSEPLIPATGKKKPKTALNAYTAFQKQRRAELVQFRPELEGQFAEQQKQLSAEWKALPEEARKPFQEEAEMDRKRFESEVQDQASQLPSVVAPEASQDLKVPVLVLAHGADGLTELRFQIRRSTPLSKVMKAWCDQHEMTVDEAAFLAGDMLLVLEDTPASIGHQAQSGSGELVVHAVPRDSPEVAEAAKRPRPAPAIEKPQKTPSSAAPAADDSPAAPSSPPPKRPASSYFLFMASRRSSLLEARPELKGAGQFGELARLLAAEWKEMGDQDKKTYEEQAEVLRQRYVPEKVAYEERHPKTPRKRASQSKAQTGRPSAADGARKPKRKRATSRRKSAGGGGSEDDEDEAAASDAESEDEIELAPIDSGASLRRSTRIRESPFGAVAGVASTVIHHPPPSTYAARKRRASDAGEAPAPAADSAGVAPAEGAALPPDPASAPVAKARLVPDHMNFREYLKFDREQEQLRAQAREARQKRKLVNGESSDEELQLAMAMSLSESQAAAPSEESQPAAPSEVVQAATPSEVSQAAAPSEESQPAPPSEMSLSETKAALPGEMSLSESQAAPPSESSETQAAPSSEMLLSESQAAPPSEMSLSESQAAHPSEMSPSESQAAPPSESSETQAAPSSEMLLSESQAAPPSEMLLSESQAAHPSEMSFSESQAAPPSESSETQAAPSSEMLLSESPAAPPSEMLLSKSQAAPPSEMSLSESQAAPHSES
ncbi:unnamed protein product [Polarella glacialis]|uniref:J domain-containing protein n=1 Tax=Polarella glacialis TaxID=89957 RepID=A0A813HA46_POLGL|nr:unnamed protein product [Polarella glacialis]